MSDSERPKAPAPSKNGVRPMGSFTAVLWVVATYVGMVAVAVALVPAGASPNAIAIAGGLAQLAIYLAVSLLIRRTSMPESGVRHAIGLRWTSPLVGLVAIGLGVCANIFADSIYGVLLQQVPLNEPSVSEMAEVMTPAMWWVFLAEITLVIPFSEEMLFRGALMRPLLVNRTKIEALVITSLLFCMVHRDWQKAIPILPLALCLGGLRQWSGSMIPGFLMHAAFNAVSAFDTTVMGPRWVTFPILGGAVVAFVLLVFAARWLSQNSAAAARARSFDD